MRFSVLGAGGWGTAVARLLANADHEVTLWSRDPERTAEINRCRENRKYLPDVALPDSLQISSDLDRSLEADAAFVAVPSFAVEPLLQRLHRSSSTPDAVINLSKGLDRASQRTMSELAVDILPETRAFALSGPSHAEEVGRDVPTAVVLAGEDLDLGRALQHAIATPRFRVYLSRDIRGVELCAALKNVIAIACGVSDGLGYGDNSRGALITRGLSELARFGRTLGICDATFFGLAGLGDLVATCTSRHSRNRHVGARLGAGEDLKSILSSMNGVAEGIYATGIVRQVAREREIDMPITEAVGRLLDGEVAPLQLVNEIMTRSPKREDG